MFHPRHIKKFPLKKNQKKRTYFSQIEVQCAKFIINTEKNTPTHMSKHTHLWLFPDLLRALNKG